MMTEGLRWQRWRWRRDTEAAVEPDPTMTLEDMRKEARARLDAAQEIERTHTGPGAEPLTGADLAEVKRLLTEADLLHERIGEAEYLQALTEKTHQMLDYYTRPRDGEASPPEAALPPRPAHWESEPDSQGVFHRGYDAGYREGWREGWREALLGVAGQLQGLAQRQAQDVRRVEALAEAYNEAEACAHPPEDEDEDEAGPEDGPAPTMSERRPR